MSKYAFSKVLTLLLVIVSFSLFTPKVFAATTYYISTTGNDTTGNGYVGTPWKTLYKACSTVSGAGDIIHVNAGTYVETQQCQLPVGVSIEGDGNTSILKSTMTTLFAALIYLQSPQGTSGNQHISNIKMDGTMTVQQGIQVDGRSNVSIHDITMVDFFERGVVFTGKLNAPLTVYATGNTFYNNTVTNSGTNNGTGYGCLNIGGQDGMLIYNNIITQNSRGEGLNGWPIKYIDEGHLKNVKIYNNTLTKNMMTGLSNYRDWPFVMELFNLEGGNEIYNNTAIGGGIDLVFMTKGTSTYSVWVHDNDISVPTLPVATQMGVTLENMEAPFAPDIRDIIIERNTMTNLSLGVYFTPRPNAVVENIYIRNNLMKNHSGIGQSGAFVSFGESGSTAQYSNLNVLNNTMIANPSAPFYTGILLPSFMASGGVANNINIKNNIIGGGSAGAVFMQGNAIPINNLNISNNNFYNHNADTDFRTSPAPTNYTFANNLHVTPTYGANYTLSSGSPLIDAGTNVGIPYLGAAPDIGYAESSGTPPPPDTTPPVISSISASTPTSSSTTISWTTNESSDTQVDYGTTTSYGSSSTLNTSMVTSHSQALSSLTAGTLYHYRVKSKDAASNLATSTDQTFTTASSGGNILPVANAGPDQSITLPTSSVTMAGSATDSDGTIATKVWSQTAGPNTTSITSTTSYTTTITGLIAGTYSFWLTVTDNSGGTNADLVVITVNAAGGGGNTYATLNPSDKAPGIILSNGNLTMSSTTDRSAVRATIGKSSGKWYWEVYLNTADNGTVGIGTIAADLTTVNSFMFNNEGWGFFPESAYRGHNGSIAPWASNGGTNGSTLGVALDMDNGQITIYVNGVSQGVMYTGITGTIYPILSSFNNTLSVFTANFGATPFSYTVPSGYNAGVYTGGGSSNVLPVANAGPDQTITLPTSSVTLAGSGTDSDGTISTKVWTKISGGGTITTPSSYTSTITGLTAGTSVFRLTVTDNSGGTAADDINIIVNPAANIAPVANAGSPQTITLPTSTVTMAGSATDADGTISTKTWSKVSGGAATITTPTSYTTTITGLVAGSYVFQLSVTDNGGAVATSNVTITVNAANIAPTANAGSDKVIVLPTSTVTLTGSGTDADGTITAYLWTKLSGGGTITSSTSATTTITGLTAGTSNFQLRVTDNSGAQATDTVLVTVNAGGNASPTANAGIDQSIVLPISTVTLAGSGTDSDGTISSYAWTKVSGSGTITTPSSATTTVTGLSVGTSVFQLMVTDNGGATATDTINIVVTALTNVIPIVNAGPAQTITLPTTSTSLTGSATDSDGTIATYLWSLTSGPTNPTISTPNTSSTSVSGLTAGTYVFTLTATDNSGGVGTSTVVITVNNAPTGGGGGSGGGGGGGGGPQSCPLGTTGIYPSCTPIVVNNCPSGTTGTYPNCITPSTGTTIYIPTKGITRSSGIPIIKQFQVFLNWSLKGSITPLVIDGKWGKKTTGIIRLFQSKNQLKADGSFGPISAGKAIQLLKAVGMWRGTL